MNLNTGGLSIAANEKPAAAATTHSAVYTRGDNTFNRRFFETKFPGFFRVVPSEADKDLILVVKTGRGEYVAKRITRISSNEMHILPLKTGTAEVLVPFGEVIQVQVRHKDAKS